MWSILMWLVIGLIAGALAKLIYPGRQGGGILATMLLGIVGSIVGAYLGNLIFNAGVLAGTPTVSGIIAAVVGAILVLFIWSMVARKRLQ